MRLRKWQGHNAASMREGGGRAEGAGQGQRRAGVDLRGRQRAQDNSGWAPNKKGIAWSAHTGGLRARVGGAGYNPRRRAFIMCSAGIGDTEAQVVSDAMPTLTHMAGLSSVAPKIKKKNRARPSNPARWFEEDRRRLEGNRRRLEGNRRQLQGN